jgi:hypothetical protein
VIVVKAGGVTIKKSRKNQGLALTRASGTAKPEGGKKPARGPALKKDKSAMVRDGR